MEEAESSASPIDFLQRLQDALKQGYCLVSLPFSTLPRLWKVTAICCRKKV